MASDSSIKGDFFADPQVFNAAGQKKFTDKDFRDVVVAARTAYMACGGKKLPDVNEIDAVCRVPLPRIAKIIATEAFAREMQKQGINWKKVKGLSAKQHYALMLLTDPTNRKPLKTRLEMAGITMGEYRNWIKQPLFAGLVNNFAEQALPDHMAQAHNSLLALVDKQHLGAIQFYYQMTGRFNPQTQVERDINSVLVQVVDIIQKAGLDQDKLEFIANGIKSLMSGSTGPKEITSYRSEREDLGLEADWDEVQIPDPTGPLVDFEYLEDEVSNTPAAVAEFKLPEVKEFTIGD